MDVTIPTSWKDINIDTYIKLVPVLETEQEDITRVINILCVLTGKKREEIKEIQLLLPIVANLKVWKKYTAKTGIFTQVKKVPIVLKMALIL